MSAFYRRGDSVIGISLPNLTKEDGLEWEASMLYLFKRQRFKQIECRLQCAQKHSAKANRG